MLKHPDNPDGTGSQGLPRYGCSDLEKQIRQDHPELLLQSWFCPWPHSQLPEGPAPVHNMWDNMQQTINFIGTFEDYILADDCEISV